MNKRKCKVVNGFFKGWNHYWRFEKKPRISTMKCSIVLADLQISVFEQKILLGWIYLDLRSTKALRNYLDKAIKELEARI